MEKKVTFNSKSSIITEGVGKKSNGEIKKDNIKKALVLDKKKGIVNSKVKKTADSTKEKKVKEVGGEEKSTRKIYVDEFDLDDTSFQQDQKAQKKYSFELFS